MTEGIRKRGSGYTVQVYLGRDATGRRRYWVRTFRTKKEAEAARAAKLAELRETGEVFVPSTKPLGAYLEEWLRAMEGRLSPATLSDYGVAVRKHIAPYLGHVPLNKLTPAKLQAFYNEAKGRVTSRVMKSIHYTLSAAMGHAVRLGLIRENPTLRVEKPRHRPREMRALSPEEASRFLVAAKGERLYPLWLILCTTGLRRGEACGLRWQDVDLDGGRLFVRQAAVVVGGKLIFKEPKTDSSKAAVPLLPEVVEALRDWRARQEMERTMTGPAWTETGLVFTTDTGKPLWPDKLQKRDMKRILRRAGLPENIRIHDLRHTVATTLFAAGVHPKLVSAVLRHSRASITQDIYTHLLPNLAEGAVQHLRKLIPE